MITPKYDSHDCCLTFNIFYFKEGGGGRGEILLEP